MDWEQNSAAGRREIEILEGEEGIGDRTLEAGGQGLDGGLKYLV